MPPHQDRTHQDRTLQSPPGPEVTVGGRRYLYFGGTSYLGLHAQPEVIAAAIDALQRYGLHSATSRSGFGETPPTREAERAIARHFGTEDAFHYASGWPGVAILVATLRGEVDAVLIDEHAHYAGYDGAALAGLPLQRFRHQDADDLAARLEAIDGRPLVICDGVFAADGSLSPVDRYAAVLEAHGGGDLCIDDAHGFGVLGAMGRGSIEHHGLGAYNEAREARRVRLFVCGTASKALGAFGGVIAGERAFLDSAREASHWFDGASAAPVPAAAALTAALSLLERQPERHTRLHERTTQMRRGLARLGIATDPAPTPVFVLPSQDPHALAQALRADGILVPHMHYRGLPPEGALRIAVCADHGPAQIERLLRALAGGAGRNRYERN